MKPVKVVLTKEFKSDNTANTILLKKLSEDNNCLDFVKPKKRVNKTTIFVVFKQQKENTKVSKSYPNSILTFTQSYQTNEFCSDDVPDFIRRNIEKYKGIHLGNDTYSNDHGFSATRHFDGRKEIHIVKNSSGKIIKWRMFMGFERNKLCNKCGEDMEDYSKNGIHR